MRRESIEDIVLRHSKRGMPILRKYLPQSYLTNAAEEILSWKRGTVLLTTGFYVAGYAETDGPLGTAMLAKALKKLGFRPVIVTDRFCEGFFEAEGIETAFMDVDADDSAADAILAAYHPVGLISIERCGRDAKGVYANMRGVDISPNSAPCDALFLKALGKIPTIGVGDGGNEIGMGNVAEVVRTELDLTPAEIRADILVIASVSNWGAYGIIAALSELTALRLLPSFEEAEEFLNRTVTLGSVDGISHEHINHVDGFGPETEQEILEALQQHVAPRLRALAS